MEPLQERTVDMRVYITFYVGPIFFWVIIMLSRNIAAFEWLF